MNQGFTLIEALVALIVIALIAIAALETQVTTLKLEQAARDAQAARLAVGRAMSAGHILPAEALAAEPQFTNANIRIRVSALTLPGKPEPKRWFKWQIVPEGRAALQAEVFTRREEQ